MKRKRLGKLQKNALNFAVKYPDWNTYSNDKTTKNVICSLKKHGLVETNKFSMFKATKRGKEVII